jgi:tRNA(Ile2) C34 agmatinyltransferase TiaS
LALSANPGEWMKQLMRVRDERPPICLRCGVTMVPAALSATEGRDGGWTCVECEELGEEE